MANRWNQRLGFVLIVLILLELGLLCQVKVSLDNAELFRAIGLGILVVLLGPLIYICGDILRMKPASSHTLTSLSKQYYTEMIQKKRLAKKLRNDMNLATQNCKKYQDAVLMDILQRQAGTEYGKKYDFSSIKSREEFVKRHPVTSYANYAEYMERIANGEENLLFKEKVLFLGLSSGTTGKNKMIPITNADLKFIVDGWSSKVHLHKKIYDAVGLKRIYVFRLFVPPSLSPARIPMGGALVYLWRPSDYDIVPMEIKDISKTDASFYVQGFFILREPELGIIEGFSSDMLLTLFKFLENKWEDLCSDMERGKLRSHPDISEESLKKLNVNLQPDKKRAAFLRRLAVHDVTGKARRIWPHLNVCYICKTGSLAYSANILKDTYLKGVRFHYVTHGSTETATGLMIEDDREEDIYTIIPHGPYFHEFIPVEDMDSPNPRCSFTDQLELGKCYEVLTTNPRGFYRYRIGDVIKIVGFRGDTPKYRFLYRTGQILNIAFDRTPESLLFEAIQTTEKEWGIKITNYTASESFNVEKATDNNFGKGKYVLFVEMKDDKILSEEEKGQFDSNLCKMHEMYKVLRKEGSLDAAMICQVKTGTFKEVQDMLTATRQNEQFKFVRVLRKPEALRHLWNNQIGWSH